MVRSHSPKEGASSLTVTSLDALDTLSPGTAGRLWESLGVADPQGLPVLPPPPEHDDAVSVATTQVVVGEIPREPPGFVARAAVGELAGAMGHSGVAVVSAVTGLRGVGKSHVAAAYARQRIEDRWPLVAWVSADSTDVLVTGLARVAERVGQADPDGDSYRSAVRLRDYLGAQRQPGLLVFDNAEDVDLVRRFLPATGGTQVVITSTSTTFAELGEQVTVGHFDRAESVAYLAQRTGIDDASGADHVAEELGDLPVALAQAASVIRGTTTYDQYLTWLAEVPIAELLERVPGAEYPRSAAAAMLLSVNRVRGRDATGLAGQLLSLMAILAPEGVPRPLLGALADGAKARSDRDLARAVQACVNGSLLARAATGDTLVMHRLLARVIRESDRTEGRTPRVVAAAIGLLEAQLLDDHAAWAQRAWGAELVLQIQSLGDAVRAPVDDELTARALALRRWAVRHLILAADLTRAIDMGLAALADSERVLGPDHPDTLTSRNNLAYAYESAGDLGKAIPLYEQTLADRERVLGPDHPDTLTSRNNLAGAYESAGDLGKAIPLYEQTLADRERVLGPDHPDTLTSRNNLAGAYESAGDLGKAIPLYEQTLADRERVLGPDHPDTLTSRNNLAGAYESAGDLGKAIPLYEQTLADRRAGAGPRPPGHPDLAEQPRRRLRVGGGPGQGDPPVRADPGRP